MATRADRVLPVIVMGVSGSGKSTLGKALARQVGRPFVEGDNFHPPANIEKMAQGRPLTDEDRWPFLDRIAEIAEARRQEGVVIACSALKRSYRNRLRERGPLFFICPMVTEEALRRRMEHRVHFMPPSLLASQLAAFEPLQPDEYGLSVSCAGSTEETCAEIFTWLGVLP